MENCSLNCMTILRSPPAYVESSVLVQVEASAVGVAEIVLGILNTKDNITYAYKLNLLQKKLTVLKYDGDKEIFKALVLDLFSATIHLTYGVFFLSTGFSQNQNIRWNNNLNSRCEDFCETILPSKSNNPSQQTPVPPNDRLGECYWAFNASPYVSTSLSGIAIPFMSLIGVMGLTKIAVGIGSICQNSFSRNTDYEDFAILRPKPFPAKRMLLSGALDLCSTLSMGILAYAAMSAPETPLGSFVDGDGPGCEKLCATIK